MTDRLLAAVLLLLVQSQPPPVVPEYVSFQSNGLTLHGVLYEPDGRGPFPAVLYNHGSAPGMLNNLAFDQLGPLFAQRGWVFFAPYRRGQELSEGAGPFIGDEIAAARNRRTGLGGLVAMPAVMLLYWLVAHRRQRWLRIASGLGLVLLAIFAVHLSAARAAAATMVRLLETDHFDDQRAAFEWLRIHPVVDQTRIATAGNSFGGVEALLGAERIGYCAAIDASGGAESWSSAPQLRERLTRAVRASTSPMFFFQAGNDYDLSPSRVLSAEAKNAGRAVEVKFYPPFGTSAAEGHSFAWAGSAVWADDAFRFLNVHCGGSKNARGSR